MISKSFLLKKLGQLTLHLVFWVFVLFFFTNFFEVKDASYNDILTYSLFLLPITIATTYVAAYKLIPDYLIKKKYWLFALYASYTFIISLYLLFVSIFFSLIYISNFEYNHMNPLTKNILYIMTAVYFIVILVSAFKLLKLNLNHVSNTKNLETKILDTQLKLKEQELHYLKMQIHPHFLFNTLNTLYGFALKKADETPDMILKLSNLLDYLLYQAEKPTVLLTDEISHIQDYIDLEKMRFNETLKVDLNLSFSEDNLTIAPMLLLPFVENSFKHGAIVNGKLFINIDLEADSKIIKFNIQNTSSEHTQIKHGIGLENIKKRLELLYKNQYRLDISNKNAMFSVELQISNTNND